MKFVLSDSSKNVVHDVSFVKFVKQITDLSRTRYSAHFDTKLSSISLQDEKFNKIDIINLFLYLEVLGLTSHTLIFSLNKPFSRSTNSHLG
ncbi:hypothetical protein T08_4454 [Trichinella sp. T8]|nr:hypothetical protein T08_4454 [Trichinella sp. T8]